MGGEVLKKPDHAGEPPAIRAYYRFKVGVEQVRIRADEAFKVSVSDWVVTGFYLIPHAQNAADHAAFYSSAVVEVVDKDTGRKWIVAPARMVPETPRCGGYRMYLPGQLERRGEWEVGGIRLPLTVARTGVKIVFASTTEFQEQVDVGIGLVVSPRRKEVES